MSTNTHKRAEEGLAPTLARVLEAQRAGTPAMIVQREPPKEADPEAVVEMVDIPSDLFIQCPKERGALIPGVTCETCDYFHGLNIRMKGPKIAFEAKYTSLCKYPQQRAFFKVKLPNAGA